MLFDINNITIQPWYTIWKEELIMSRPKLILIAVAVVMSIASIMLAILSTVSPETTIVFLGIGLLVISAALLQKQKD
jgi:hypothetical protein